MASQRDQVANTEAAADSSAKKLERSFIDATGRLRDGFTLSAAQRNLESFNYSAVTDEADRLAGYLIGKGIPPGEKSFEDYLIEALGKGGEAGIEAMPPSVAMQASFTVINPLAVTWANEYIPSLIREITHSTRMGIAEVIRYGVDNQIPPRATARNIREMIGLTQHQSRAVINYRKQLEARSNLQGITPADKRLVGIRDQKTIARHFREGHLTQEKIDEMVDRYYKNLVKMRADTIARTESFRAVEMGEQLSWESAVQDGLVEADDVIRKWVTARDDRVRPEHAAIPKMNKDGVGLREPFKTPSGPVMQPPFGVNCRCSVVYRIK
jgi:hypothetical protein